MAEEMLFPRSDRYVDRNISEFKKANRTPISGYEDLPLMSLEQAIEPIIPFVDKIESFVYDAKQKCIRDSNHLTLDESAAIYLYTMPTVFFSRLNESLRTEERDSIKPWFAFLKLFMSALEKLPPYTGVVWRAVSGDIGRFSINKKPQIWWSVNSCSKATNVVEVYLGSTGTLFTIAVVQGKDISKYSAFPEEQEVIIVPGACVHLVSTPLTHTHLVVVHLQETSSVESNHEENSCTSDHTCLITPPNAMPRSKSCLCLITVKRFIAFIIISGLFVLTWIFVVTLTKQQKTNQLLTSTITTISTKQTVSTGSYQNVSSSGRWLSTGTLNIGRIGHTSTVLFDGRVITIGGNQGGNTVEFYDPEMQQWTEGPPMIHHRTCHATTLLSDGRLIVTGGYYYNTYINTAEIFNPLTYEWTLVSNMTIARCGHQAVYLPPPTNKLLVLGGFSAAGIGLASCELYDFATNNWNLTDSMQDQRVYFTAMYIPTVEKVLAIGGGFQLKIAEMYNISSGQWTRSGNCMSDFRQSFAATFIPAIGQVLIAGSGEGLKTTYLFNPKTNSFKFSANTCEGRIEPSAALLPSSLVLITGGYNRDNSIYSSAEVYDYRINTWSLVATMNKSRFRHTSHLINITSSSSPVVLVIGGQQERSMSTKICELFYPNG